METAWERRGMRELAFRMEIKPTAKRLVAYRIQNETMDGI
jgi:hypothetical protein